MAAERIYFVRTRSDSGPASEDRLVRASHPSTALAHVANTVYVVTVATQNDLEELLGKGIKVENVKAEQQQLPT